MIHAFWRQDLRHYIQTLAEYFVPINKGELTFIDTWAGRGGLGSKMVQDHGIVAIIYGGTVVDEDFRDRKVADEWFENKYKQN